jgi:hypothetical protein
VVYEKIKDGIWAFNGLFLLTDAWQEHDSKRFVFKLRLKLDESRLNFEPIWQTEFEQTRVIPSAVKCEVWKRDKGKCVLCGSTELLHYDHDLPYSKGGSSLALCAPQSFKRQ